LLFDDGTKLEFPFEAIDKNIDVDMDAEDEEDDDE